MVEHSVAGVGPSDRPPRVRLAQGQEVSLGCGTLVLIALIVLFFSGRGTGNLDQDVHRLRSEVGDLKKAVDGLSSEIRQLRDRLPPPKAGDPKGKD